MDRIIGLQTVCKLVGLGFVGIGAPAPDPSHRRGRVRSVVNDVEIDSVLLCSTMTLPRGDLLCSRGTNLP